jgi:hypothetical protein
MHNLHRHQISNIGIELPHKKVHIEEIIELPAFADQRVAEDLRQPDTVDIVFGGGRKVSNVR